MKYKSGFSFLEMIIVIAIIGILLAIVAPSFSNFRNRQVVRNTTEDIVALLNKARTNTLLSKNSTYYSVHLSTTSATLFTGGTYDASSSSNEVITFDTLVTVPSASVSLNGGGSDVTFDRLTGDTSQYGTIQIKLVSDSNVKKTITINKLGIISSN
jgi:prepilin-type N-terminal cleavage/methylation domain-containing protein